MHSKKEIRKMILARRDAMTETDRIQKSAIVCRELLKTKAYQEADTILCFLSYASEIATFPFLQECFREGKSVYVPKVNGDEMHFFRIRETSDLEKGYKGIPEPVHTDDEFCAADERMVLLIMPGVAFDECGNRIGYGKGFYDRFLSGGFNGCKIAICFDCQIVKKNSFEVDETDVKPDFVLSEKRCINIIG